MPKPTKRERPNSYNSPGGIHRPRWSTAPQETATAEAATAVLHDQDSDALTAPQSRPAEASAPAFTQETLWKSKRRRRCIPPALTAAGVGATPTEGQQQSSLQPSEQPGKTPECEAAAVARARGNQRLARPQRSTSSVTGATPATADPTVCAASYAISQTVDVILPILGGQDSLQTLACVCRCLRMAVLSSSAWGGILEREGLLSVVTLKSQELSERRSKGRVYAGFVPAVILRQQRVREQAAIAAAVSQQLDPQIHRSNSSSSNATTTTTTTPELLAPVAIRSVNLKVCNAEVDDGVPASLLRELALLQQLQRDHAFAATTACTSTSSTSKTDERREELPIVRYVGAELKGSMLHVCTQFHRRNLRSYWRVSHVKPYAPIQQRCSIKTPHSPVSPITLPFHPPLL
ncbi:uncharacterized protein LOC113146803 [Cyclospora cayetanensis]|uniref:Uncharacterized protein LOC113146803 n=1 Tax=Cyclospora cayetanensis TaxID=88456 RepID=A0A6P6RTZ0_9EIME|nr:uncharacterized protein LOC113146803 [Cyclospora cayetanensis]